MRAQTFSMPGTSRRHGPPASLTCAPTPTLSIAPLDSGFRALERYRELTRRPLIRCATRCCAVARNVFSAKGEATSPESGVGYLNGSNPTNYSMSAYKFHLSDPIVRSEPSRPSGSVSFARCCFCRHCTSRFFFARCGGIPSSSQPATLTAEARTPRRVRWRAASGRRRPSRSPRRATLRCGPTLGPMNGKAEGCAQETQTQMICGHNTFGVGRWLLLRLSTSYRAPSC